MDFTLRDVEIVVITLGLRDGGAWLRRLYQRRYIEPKRQNQQLLLDYEQWFEERAAKLAAFCVQLGEDQAPDKWKLARLVSQLDAQDKQWAMKQTDIEALRTLASKKSAECHDNAGEYGRMADEVAYKIFS